MKGESAEGRLEAGAAENTSVASPAVVSGGLRAGI